MDTIRVTELIKEEITKGEKEDMNEVLKKITYIDQFQEKNQAYKNISLSINSLKHILNMEKITSQDHMTYVKDAASEAFYI